MKKFMIEAYKMAKKAYRKNEMPVGAVIVKNGKIISKSCNNRQKTHNILGHAEINCIIKACKRTKDWRLDGCDMYLTLSPCKMCYEIIKESRISNVYYLCDNRNNVIINDEKYQTFDCSVLHENYSDLINHFFQKLRK